MTTTIKATGDKLERLMPTAEYQSSQRTVTDGDYTDLQSDSLGNLKTTKVASTSSILSTTLQNAVSATGNGTAQAVSGYGSAIIEVTGTFTATVNFEGSRDGGTTYYAIYGTYPTGVTATSTTATGIYRVTCEGLTHIRARVTWTSGTSVTVVSTASVDYAANQIQPTAFTNAIDAVNDKIQTRPEANSFQSISASTLIRTGATTLMGFFISSNGGTGTIKVWDNTAGSGTVAIDTITPTTLGWYPVGNIGLTTGCYVTLANTITITVVYKDNTIV